MRFIDRKGIFFIATLGLLSLMFAVAWLSVTPLASGVPARADPSGSSAGAMEMATQGQLSDSSAQRDGPATAREVFNRFAQSGLRFLVVYGSGSPQLEAAAASWAQRFPFDQGRDLEGLPPAVREVFEGFVAQIGTLRIESDAAIDDSDLRGRAVILVGTPRSNRTLAGLLDRLPVRFDGAGFVFLGRHYDQPGDVLNLRIRNPLDPSQPLYLITGNDDAEISRRFFRVLQLSDYEVLRHGIRQRFGRFVEGEPGRGTEAGEHDLDAELVPVAQTEHYRVLAHRELADSAAAGLLAEEREAIRSRVEALLDRMRASGEGTGSVPIEGSGPIEGNRRADSPVDLVVYPTLEEKAKHTGESALTSMNENTRTLSLTLEGDLYQEDWPREVAMLARQALGAPRYRALEVGLGLYLSDGWRRRGFRYWAARLAAADQLWSLDELLQNEGWSWRSEHVSEALAGSLVAYLIESRWGAAGFGRRYASWELDAEERRQVQDGWHAWVRGLIGANPAAPRRAAAAGFQRGVNLTNEAFQIHGGFLSETVDAALQEAASMDVDAVAIVPYAPYPFRDRAAPISAFRGPRKETDGGVLHTVLQARARGMRVLLKPQLEGPWPGFIKMRDEASWEAFFHHYERLIVHYAMLAEFYQMDLLSVGVELVEATAGHENRWRDLIARVRQIFRGDLVYSANWGTEIEHIGFWDALDFIGIDAYFPLDGLGGLTVAHLSAAWNPHLDRIAIWRHRQGLQQPVLFTELGYESARGAAATPWGVDRSRPTRVDLQLQADLYTAFFRGPYQRELLGGVFWWRWNPLGGGPLDSGFAPNGKPTVEALRRALTADQRRPTYAGRS